MSMKRTKQRTTGSSRHSGKGPSSDDAGEDITAASREWNGKLIDQASH